jgi:hypothetical protein
LDDFIEKIGAGADLSGKVIGVLNVLMLAFSAYQVWRAPATGSSGSFSPPTPGMRVAFANGTVAAGVDAIVLKRALEGIGRLVEIGALDPGFIAGISNLTGSRSSPIPELGRPEPMRMGRGDDRVREPASAGPDRSGAGSAPSGPGTGTARGPRPTLLRQATDAGVREVIEEGPIEVFAHGTTRTRAQELVETQGDVLSARGGRFAGEFYAVPNVEVADVFAARAATRTAGEQPMVIGVALPRAAADRLRQLGLLKRGLIDNPPLGVPAGTQQWVFEPGALETLRSEGFFFYAF